MAQTLLAQGRLPEAEPLFREWLASQPDAADALEGLGVLMFQTDQLEEAAALFARAAAIQPNSARFHAKLGAAYRRLKQFDQSRTHIERAIELDPALPEAWNSLGRLAFDQRATPTRNPRIVRP